MHGTKDIKYFTLVSITEIGLVKQLQINLKIYVQACRNVLEFKMQNDVSTNGAYTPSKSRITYIYIKLKWNNGAEM